MPTRQPPVEAVFCLQNQEISFLQRAQTNVSLRLGLFLFQLSASFDGVVQGVSQNYSDVIAVNLKLWRKQKLLGIYLKARRLPRGFVAFSCAEARPQPHFLS